MARKASLASVRKALVASGLFLLVAPLGLAQTESGVDYETQIRPLFASYCYECHGSNRAAREADLRLDQKSFALRDLGGYHAIVPGEPQESELFLRISSEFAEDRMPPYDAGIELTADEIDLIRQWIVEGADWPEGVDENEPQPARRAAGLPSVEFLPKIHVGRLENYGLWIDERVYYSGDTIAPPPLDPETIFQDCEFRDPKLPGVHISYGELLEAIPGSLSTSLELRPNCHYSES